MSTGLIILVLSWFLSFSGFIGYLIPKIKEARIKREDHEYDSNEKASAMCFVAMFFCWIATIIYFVVIV